jgi:general stress protein YciG
VRPRPTGVENSHFLTSIKNVNRGAKNALGRTVTHQTAEFNMATNGASSGAKRGFAAMSPEKQREIASKGGKASHGGGRKSTRLV